MSDPTVPDPIREALAPEELAALTALTAGDVDANTASTLRTLFDDAVAYEDVRVAVRAALSDSTPSAPTLDAERRLYVLTKLVQIAYDEMPERLHNATRVHVNEAAAYARGGYSSGLTREFEAEYARLHETSQP